MGVVLATTLQIITQGSGKSTDSLKATLTNKWWQSRTEVPRALQPSRLHISIRFGQTGHYEHSRVHNKLKAGLEATCLDLSFLTKCTHFY